MTISMVPAYVAACNAPGCPTLAVLADLRAVAPGWLRMRSNDHFQPDPRESVYAATNRRNNILTYSERSYGSFEIDLCPQHPDAFAGHVPTTDGRPGSRGRSSIATVGCSCGYSYGYVLASSAEEVWRGHLPLPLREYGDRPAERRGRAERGNGGPVSAPVYAVPVPAPSHGGTGGHETTHYPCCRNQDVALCSTDVTGHEFTGRHAVDCPVCDALRHLPCVKICPLNARKEP